MSAVVREQPLFSIGFLVTALYATGNGTAAARPSTSSLVSMPRGGNPLAPPYAP